MLEVYGGMLVVGVPLTWIFWAALAVLAWELWRTYRRRIGGRIVKRLGKRR